MILHIGNAVTSIEFTETKDFVSYLSKRIHEAVDPLDPNRFRSAAYKKHHTWDGRSKIYDMKTHKFPTGLFDDAWEVIKAEQEAHPELIVEVDDQRGASITPEVPEHVQLGNGDKEPITLFEHQQKAVEFAIKHQEAVVDIATNGGKTEVASAVISLDLPLLNKYDDLVFFLCQSKSIAHQTQARLEKRLGVPVGLWGDGTQDIKQVTVGMIGTIANALKDPTAGVKLTSNKDTKLKHFALNYTPKFSGKRNLALLIRTFLRNNRPKYKYEDGIFEDLQAMVELKDDRKIQKALEWYPKEYRKKLLKKNRKGVEKYEQAIDLLERGRVVIVDESHHAVADTYQLVLKHLPNARQRIGLTGTVPSQTNDPIGYAKFKGCFGEAAFKVTNEEMINKGISAKPIISLVPITQPIDLDQQVAMEMPSNVPKMRIDLLKYQTAYRLGVVESEYRNKVIGSLVGRIHSQSNEPTLIVVNSIEHGEIIRDALPEGIVCEFLQGSSTQDERQATLDRVKNGETQVIIGTQMIDEGVDLPNLKYLIYASAGKSNRQLLQRVGRMLRIAPDKHTVHIFDLQDRTTKILFDQAKSRLGNYRHEHFEIRGN